MVNRTLKYGGKSGILPAAREIFKLPIKKVERPIEKNTGYAPNVKEPRNTPRELRQKPVFTVNDRIAKTVALPKDEPLNLNKIPKEQKEKILKAQLRREYFIHSVKKEEKRLEQVEQDEIKLKKYLEEKELSNIVKASPAAALTLPTLSSYLDGPLMRNRTKEEEKMLHDKKTANRKTVELKLQSRRAADLLGLYYAAEEFITTESDLLKAVDKAFATGNEVIAVFNPEHMPTQNAEKIGDALFGTIKGKPGVPTVLEQITGEASGFKKQIHEAAQSKLAAEREAESDKL